MISLNRVPPRPVRLLIVTPVVFAGAAVVTILSPLLHLVLLAVDLVDRKRFRFSRLGGLGIAMCVVEFVGLLLAFGLWIASGFGAFIGSAPIQRAHNEVFGWWLELMTRALRFYLGFEFVIPVTERVDGPVLTFARHAGPGDAFLLAHTVIRDYHRQLRMVGATKLLWDPFIDHMLRRMPYCFCDPNPANADRTLDDIATMTRTMDDDTVSIIFPEGGNWTPHRWERAIERLEERGRHEQAELAAEMHHVLPPRTAGAIAAIEGRRDATVVFVAHAGLDDLYSLRRIWRRIPLRRTVAGVYWAVPPDAVPVERPDITRWLFEQWMLVDRWIDDHSASLGPTDT